MIEPLYQLAYEPGAHDDRFPLLRYPSRHGVPMHTAELMRAAMPKPELFRIVREGE